jgi:hypothetical protein
METYPYQTDIELSRLRLDLRNPRVASDPDSQREAFEAVATEQKVKLLNLARHIAHNGLSPVQRFIVIPDEDNFVVLDANRRLAAIKALEAPDLMQGFLSEMQLSHLRTLASNFDPPGDVPCVVFAKREDADVWVELLHGGQQDGVGHIEWSAQQAARHRGRRGVANLPHMQVLDFVLREGSISEESRKRSDEGTYPVSTLERALTTPYLRDRLGIEIEKDGKVVTKFPKPEVLKGLTKLVDEIGTGKVKVGTVMSKEDRARYADSLRTADLPDPVTRATVAAPLHDAPSSAQGTARPRGQRSPSARPKMVAAAFSANINVPRIEAIFGELKRHLLLRDSPNAIAVLYRVFFELSVDAYISREPSLAKAASKKLYQKVEAILDHLEAVGTVKKRDMQQVRRAVQDPPTLNVTTNLNAFVHNPNIFPTPVELRGVWDSCEPFIKLLWP